MSLVWTIPMEYIILICTLVETFYQTPSVHIRKKNNYGCFVETFYYKCIFYKQTIKAKQVIKSDIYKNISQLNI